MNKEVDKLLQLLTSFTRKTGLVLSVSITSEYANLVLKTEWESKNKNYHYTVVDDKFGEYVFCWQESNNQNDEH